MFVYLFFHFFLSSSLFPINIFLIISFSAQDTPLLPDNIYKGSFSHKVQEMKETYLWANFSIYLQTSNIRQ